MKNIDQDLLMLVHKFIVFNDSSTKDIPIDKLIDLKFYELQLDSLEIMELIIEIEDKFSIRIVDEVFIDTDDWNIKKLLVDITKLIN